MRFNLFLTGMAIALAALLGYLAYVVAGVNPDKTAYGIGCLICFAITLLPAIGISYQSSRIAANARVASSIFFIAFFIINAVFVNADIRISYYIIVNGLFIVGYLIAIYNLINIKNI